VEIDVLGPETLFDGDDIAALGAHLRSLMEGECAADRLVVNFAGVRAMSSDVLGILATLARPASRAIRVRGINPMLEQMLRICRLDRFVEVEGGEVTPP
jgi:anti-anti-sigma regulatory factor